MARLFMSHGLCSLIHESWPMYTQESWHTYSRVMAHVYESWHTYT